MTDEPHSPDPRSTIGRAGVNGRVTRPDRFDRERLAAIIGRATEITHRAEAGDDDDDLSIDDLVAVADDVGLSPSAVVTALAESRAGVDHRPTVLDRLVGPRQVWTINRLPAGSARPVDDLRHWLEVDHGLRTYILAEGVVVAEPKSGVSGAVSSALRRVGGTRGLERSRRVNGAVASIGETASLCVVADLGHRQVGAAVGGSAVAGGTALMVAVVAAVTSPVVLLGLPVGLASGVVLARRTHRRHVDAVSMQIEVTAEAVVRGETPEHPVERFVRTRILRQRRI